jgi:hypothetical protein
MVQTLTLQGCGCATVAGLLLNACVAAWARAGGGAGALAVKRHPLFLVHSSASAPLWMWMLSATLQSCVYPVLFALSAGRGRPAAFAAGAVDASASWLAGTDSRLLSAPNSPDLMYLRWFLYVFFGYLARDLPFTLGDPMFMVHHLACMAGIWTTLESTSPGAVSAALGILILESGSLFFNLWSVDGVVRVFPGRLPLWPRFPGGWGEYLLEQSYIVGTTASNVGSWYFLYLTANAAWAAGDDVFAWFAMVSGTLLILFREWEIIKVVRGQVQKPGLREEDRAWVEEAKSAEKKTL